MLGEKRSNSVFAPAKAQEEPKKMPTENVPAPEPPAVSVIEDTPEKLAQPTATGRAHSLFFTPEDEGREFTEVLREVQGYIASNYATLMTGATESREQIRRYAAKYIQDKRIAVAGMSADQLVDAIYSEMAE